MDGDMRKMKMRKERMGWEMGSIFRKKMRGTEDECVISNDY
jgi:hypothetical protein